MKKSKHYYTQEEKQFFVEYHYGHSRKEIAEEFEKRFGLHMTDCMVKKQIDKLGGTGRDTRFKYGNPYINKVRLDNLTEKLHSCKNGKKEWKIKVNGTWIRKNRYIYEQEFGEIPEGYRLIYVDGNSENCTLENLKLIKDAVNTEMARSRLGSVSSELRKSAIAVCELNVCVKEREKVK